MTDQSSFAAGLRALADIIDANPDMPLPHNGAVDPLTWHFLHGEDPRAAMTATRRALGIQMAKNDPDARPGYSETYMEMRGSLHGLGVRLVAFREQVCERVIVATREVVTEEPDPDAVAEAVAALPKVRRVETVEDVEWRCHPILAESPVSSPSQDGGKES